MSPIWASTSQFYGIDAVDNTTALNITQSSDAIGMDSTNRNLSKMRSYLKRCENAINSINLSGKRTSSPTTSSSSAITEASTPNDIQTKQSTSLWYIDELGSEINEGKQHNEFNDIDSNSKVTQIMEPTIYTDSMDRHTTTTTTTVNNESVNERIHRIQSTLSVSRSCCHYYLPTEF